MGRETLFKETDDLIRLGKWVYMSIPSGPHCKGCPILRIDGVPLSPHWHCDLRPAFSLCFDEEGPFKGDTCPRRTTL